MATGTGGIATQSNANDVYVTAMGGGLVVGPYQNINEAKRCITYASAINAGFTVANADRYTSNTKRLVRYSDLSYPARLVFKVTIDISSESYLYNYGPITLNRQGGDLVPLLYARDTEAIEIEQDSSGIPLEYPITHNEETTETNMTLSTVDEVLQVVQEFEEQDQILGAPVLFLGLSLIKDDGDTNLLTATTYGPVSVSSKKVTFTLLSTSYSSSSNGSYKLNYAVANCLMNKDGLYPSGALYYSSSSTSRYHTLTVNSAGTYTFNAYWKKSTTPDPSTPTPTSYIFRLRFALDGIAVYQVYVAFTCTIYSSTGTVIGSYNIPGTAYIPSTLPMDMTTNNSQIGGANAWYYIDLYTGTTLPYFVKVSYVVFQHNTNNMMSWLYTTHTAQNSNYWGSSPSLSGSGTAYYTLNHLGTVYCMDYLIGGAQTIDPIRPL